MFARITKLSNSANAALFTYIVLWLRLFLFRVTNFQIKNKIMIRPVNDFRIGNLVLDEDSELCKIEQLSSEKMECFQQVSNIENKSCISTKYPSNIYAIELTEEWFLKAGFIHKNGYGRIHSKLKGNIFISECGSYYVYQYYDIRIELKYVHQLQNLYFALCGEELFFSTTEP